MTMRLKGKVAIITGSSRGIGYATAKLFLQEGAKVVLCSQDRAACIAAAKRIGARQSDCLAVRCDVSKKKDVDRLVATTVKRFGRIDTLVNNAGVFWQRPFIDVPEKEYDGLMAINLKGAFFMAQAVAREMLKRKTRGCIVNIASIAGQVGFGDSAAYCASKGGLINLTRELAVELAPRGIRVNAIGPGPIKTAMTKRFLGKPKARKAIEAQVPLGRFGEPEEIAEAALFLASAASSYVTGHTLFVDGGWLAQ
jgi:glucose 1-dehydrogenase/3-oxoacyl-[acyl-carrier protein] reductase